MDKYADTTAVREPLFTDVASAVIGKRDVEMIGGRYGIFVLNISDNLDLDI